MYFIFLANKQVDVSVSSYCTVVSKR